MKGIGVVAIFVLYGLCSSVVLASTRVAVLASAGSAAEKVAALLEVSLPAHADVQLLERQQFADVLREQQLDGCFGADAGDSRLKIGRLIKADAMVVLREPQKPTPHVELVVFETAHGLRLLCEPATLSTDVEVDTAKIEQRIIVALHKLQEGITAVVAVPDFVCNDLTHEFADAGRGYAPLVEQSLLRRKGVMVVEIAEARAIANELAIGGQNRLERPSPFFVLGDYRNVRVGDQHTLTLRLQLTHGDMPTAELPAIKVDPNAAAASLLDLTDHLIGNNLSQPSTPGDPKADASQLYRRASVFIDISAFEQGLSLCEASLLLDSQPEVHRAAAFAIAQLRGIGRENGANRAGTESLFQNDGLLHIEAYMKDARLGYMNPQNVVVKNYLHQLAPQVSAGLMVRVARVKFDRKMSDDTLRFAADIRWSDIEPVSKRYELCKTLGLLAASEQDERWVGLIFSRCGSEPSPERDAALSSLAASENPFAKQSVAMILQMAAPVHGVCSPASSIVEPMDQRADERPVTLVKLDLPFRPAGCFAAGDLDIMWGSNGDAKTNTVFAVSRDGNFKPLFKSGPHAQPVYDGRFVWNAGDDADHPRIVIADPVTGKQLEISTADGLPDEKISGFAAVPLAPGRVCAAAAMGSSRELRSWIAILSIDVDAVTDGKKFKLLQEAKLSSVTPTTHRLGNDVAFLPRMAERLAGESGSSDAILAGFSDKFGWHIVTFPTTQSTFTGAGVTVTTDDKVHGTYVHAGQIYETEMTHAGDTTTGQLMRGIANGKGSHVVNSELPFGPMLITDLATYVFNPGTLSLYIADSPTGHFRPIKTIGANVFLQHSVNRLCWSNRYGPLLFDEQHLYRFDGIQPRRVATTSPAATATTMPGR